MGTRESEWISRIRQMEESPLANREIGVQGLYVCLMLWLKHYAGHGLAELPEALGKGGIDSPWKHTR